MNNKLHGRATLRRMLAVTTLAIAIFGVIAALAFINSQAAVAESPARINAPAQIGMLQASVVFTDVYETASDQQGTAPQIASGVVPCNLEIVSLSFYKSGATDIDWYAIQTGAQLSYTVTVLPQNANDSFNIQMNVLDSGNVALFGTTGPRPSYTFYTYAATRIYLQLSSAVAQPENHPYKIVICSAQSAVSPTPSLTPTNTPTLTPTPDPSVSADSYESNNTPTEAQIKRSFISVGQTISALNFYSPFASGVRENGDVDWYFFYAKSGSTYSLTTVVNPGVDTEMFLFRNPPPTPPENVNTSGTNMVASNDDYQSLNRGSQIVFQASYDGVYWVKLWNRDQSPRTGGQTYSLKLEEFLQISATATPFALQIDKYEYNGDFDNASLIASGAAADANFVPYRPVDNSTVDNDFYRLNVKENLYYTCETQKLGAGVDTNIIVYDQNRNGIGGNDDISKDERAKGNFASRFSWLSRYTGIVYILVGEVNPPKANESSSHTYSLICNVGLPVASTPDPAATQNAPPVSSGPKDAPPALPTTTFTPIIASTVTPTPAPVVSQSLIVKPIIRSTPTPAQPVSTARTANANVQIYNDRNRNKTADGGEGIANVSVWLIDDASGSPLAQGFTDADGRVRLNATTEGNVRLSVPLFGYAQTISDNNANVSLALTADVILPSNLP